MPCRIFPVIIAAVRQIISAAITDRRDNMTAELFWKLFTETGNIIYYLIYKKLSLESSGRT